MTSESDTPDPKDTDVAAALSVLMCCVHLRAQRREPIADRLRQLVMKERNEWDEV
jgi:hypothetical protein